jgi:polyhydroxyalkanoate synthesis regulator phasin
VDLTNPIKLLKKGFHVSLGATSSLLESIQDPRKRDENLAQLRLGPNQITEIWSEKGEVTEQEARKFVDSLVSQASQTNSTSSGSSRPATTVTTPETIKAQVELEELTSQLADLRNQLAKEKQTGDE